MMRKACARHISVCVPTFKRPSMLDRCLEAIEGQEQSGFTYSVVVVDNDWMESAREIVSGRQKRAGMRLEYFVEPEQNISKARNAAVANSHGELIAFIDDDELPCSTWLKNLHTAFERFSADGVLGPVIPRYEGTPPAWLIRSGLCTRRSFKTGARLINPRYLRAGNLLFSRRILEKDRAPFSPDLGRSCGEDADFLGRMVEQGRIFVWCEEAKVYEEVPRDRQTRSYHLRRAFLRGMTSATPGSLFSAATLRSVAATIVYTASLPFLLAAGHHLFMKYLVKDCDHLAKLLAYCGITVVRERTD